MTTPRKSWFDVGYQEGREGKPERPPEGLFSPRCQYREGWMQGRIDRVQAGEASPTEIE